MQLRFTVEYDGTAYQGWQVQPTGVTIQALLEQAFTTALRVPVRVAGAGRTDAGVHASGQVAVVRTSMVPGDLGRLARSVNALTPDDIAIRDLVRVDDAFDPRRHARSRSYTYRLWTAAAASPFWSRYTWHVRRPLDVEAMRTAAATVLGSHDFAAFGASDGNPGFSTVREVFVSTVAIDGAMVVYTIEATAFLKHMVRGLVGTLVDIGSGVRPVNGITQALVTGDRRLVGRTVPPQGLVLTAVRY